MCRDGGTKDRGAKDRGTKGGGAKDGVARMVPIFILPMIPSIKSVFWKGNYKNNIQAKYRWYHDGALRLYCSSL
jgi:hypothetical protein